MKGLLPSQMSPSHPLASPGRSCVEVEPSPCVAAGVRAEGCRSWQAARLVAKAESIRTIMMWRLLGIVCHLPSEEELEDSEHASVHGRRGEKGALPPDKGFASILNIFATKGCNARPA